MSIADYAAYLDQLRLGLVAPFAKAGINLSDFMSLWTSDPEPGVAPTSSVATSNTTRGALPFAGHSTARLLQVDAWSVDSYGSTSLVVADRLVHSGGLSGTNTGVQTTNLPSAALTRYTSGECVRAALEVYTALGATQVDAAISYTNQAGTAGRTGTARIGSTAGTGRGNVGAICPIMLQAGDYGVRSVESVQLAATTGAVGNFGVTLYRPLFVAAMIAGRPSNTRGTAMKVGLDCFLDGGCVPKLEAGCCVWLYQRNLGLANDAVQGRLTFGVEP